ncbi:hypothetical protein [Phocaeicola sp.]
MNTKYFLIAIFVAICHLTSKAQSYLPMENSFSFGGGIAGGITECKGDYLDIAGNPACYNLGAEFRHYFTPNVGLGATYEYIGSSKYQNKMNCHYIAPTFTLRGLWANGKQGFWCSGGIGYLNYSDELKSGKYGSSTFSHGYFAVSLGIGYEFAVAPGFGMQIKAECIMADWHSNPDYTPKWNRYDPDEYQSLFNNNLSYISLGLSFIIGK